MFPFLCIEVNAVDVHLEATERRGGGGEMWPPLETKVPSPLKLGGNGA